MGGVSPERCWAIKKHWNNKSYYTVASCWFFHHHHHHHISVMELGHLLTRSGLTYPEVSSKFCHDSFCQLGNSVLLPGVIYYRAFYLHFISSFSCIPVICLKLVLFLIPLQFVHLFSNQSKCILLFFSCISSLLLLFYGSFYEIYISVHGSMNVKAHFSATQYRSTNNMPF